MQTKRMRILTAMAIVTVALSVGLTTGCRKSPSPAVTVTVSASELTLDFFESGVLKATVTGSDALPVWQSDDETVATVDAEGRVYAKGVGQTVVRAIVGKISASCAVFVQDSGEIPVIRMNYPALELASGVSVTLTAEAFYKKASIEAAISFATLDEAVAAVSHDGKVTAVSPGNTYIIASAVCNGVTVYAKTEVAVLR